MRTAYWIPEPLSHFPGTAVPTRHQFARRWITDNLFFLYVPADLFSSKHGDKAKMSWDCRVVPDFDRRNGCLPSSHTVQKILLMIGRGVELHLAQLSRKVLSLLPFR